MTKCVIVCIIITCLANLKKLLGEVVENIIIYSLKSLLSFLWNFGLDSCGLGDALHLGLSLKAIQKYFTHKKRKMKERTTSNVKEQVKYLPTTKELRSMFSKSIRILYMHTFPFTELRICTFWLVKHHFPMHNWVPPTLIPRGKFSLELVSNCWNHMALVG